MRVLRPHESFKWEPIELNSSKTVVDFTKPGSSDESQPDFHADLDLPVDAGDEIPRVPQALIVDSRGRLQVLSPHRDAPSHMKAAQFLAAEYQPWEHLKPRKNPQSQGEGGFNYGGELDDLEGFYAPESFDGRGSRSGRTRGPRKSNPLRRSR